ncbi:hypothetical protein [Desulfovirgula thermocuniculi]|nr:hypothetical protein [Desulfovirgula thermocuniculi]
MLVGKHYSPHLSTAGCGWARSIEVVPQETMEYRQSGMMWA